MAHHCRDDRGAGAQAFEKWICVICGFIYHEALGLPEDGIPPRTHFTDIPDDWQCPLCGVSKRDFERVVS